MKFFSVSAEESVDCSNMEQSLVLWFVDPTNAIHDEFVEFFYCDIGKTGSALAEKVLQRLRDCGPLAFCEGRDVMVREYAWKA